MTGAPPPFSQPSFVPARRPTLRAAERAGRPVLLDEATGRGFDLDGPESLVWQYVDGSTTLDGIATLIAEDLAVSDEAARRDTLAVLQAFLRRGFVVDARDFEGAPPTADDGIPSRAVVPPECTGRVGARIGDDVVVVAGNDEPSLALLVAALGTHAVHAPERPPELWLRVDAAVGAIRPLHELGRDGTVVLRTPSIGRLLRAALAHLDDRLPPPPGTLRVDAHALVGAKSAVLVTGVWRDVLAAHAWRLARWGWRAVDGDGALVDPASLEVVLRAPVLGSGAGRAALDRAHPRDGTEPPRRDRRVPIGRVVLVVGSAGPGPRVDPSVLAQTLTPAGADRDPCTELAVSLLARTEVVTRAGVDDQEVLFTIRGRAPRPLPPTLARPPR